MPVVEADAEVDGRVGAALVARLHPAQDLDASAGGREGAVEDPDVTYMPVKSFASGLSGLAQLAVDVLTNTLTLPIDLATSDEESKTPAPDAGLPSESSPRTP